MHELEGRRCSIGVVRGEYQVDADHVSATTGCDLARAVDGVHLE